MNFTSSARRSFRLITRLLERALKIPARKKNLNFPERR